MSRSVSFVLLSLVAFASNAAAARECHRAPDSVARALRVAIVKRFVPEHTDGSASITLPCDELGATIREIVVETGDGHGGTLAIWRARRTTGNRFAVHGIVYRGRSMIYEPADPPYELADGEVEIPDLDVDRVRAALVVHVTEVSGASEGFGLQESFSSHDFHVLVRIVDDDGRVAELRFTGYESSIGQDHWIPAAIAVESLGAITTLPTVARPAQDDDRALFAERFVATVPHFDDEFAWWVKERFVDLARYLGTAPVVPGLETRLVITKRDRSSRDTRTNAAAALAAIASRSGR